MGVLSSSPSPIGVKTSSYLLKVGFVGPYVRRTEPLGAPVEMVRAMLPFPVGAPADGPSSYSHDSTSAADTARIAPRILCKYRVLFLVFILFSLFLGCFLSNRKGCGLVILDTA